MKQKAIPDYPHRNDGMTRDEVIELVRVELIRYLEINRQASLAEVALRCGYAKRTLYGFIERESDSLVLAQKIIIVYPEIGAGLPCVCDCCGRLPHFSMC